MAVTTKYLQLSIKFLLFLRRQINQQFKNWISSKFNKITPEYLFIFLCFNPAPSNLLTTNNQKNHKMKKDQKTPTSSKICLFYPNIFSTCILAVLLIASSLMMGHIQAKPVVTSIQWPCSLTGPSLMLTTISPTLGNLYCKTRTWLGRTYNQIRQNQWQRKVEPLKSITDL